jgi:hypothetical protein
MNKSHYIDLLRKAGFNCFPIDPQKGKQADHRYNAAKTTPNQPILEHENYGYIPTVGNCILDLDDKEKFRPFAERVVEQGYLVCETGKGWQIPVINLSGNISKIELYDYDSQDNKIVEIQGSKHYCVGIGSVIFHDKLQRQVEYINIGTDKIFDGKNLNFDDFVSHICKTLNVTGKEFNKNQNYAMRKRFSDQKIPSKGTSNNYFFNAALVCNTEGQTKKDAIERIKKVFDKWTESPTYSGRSWSNVESKINEVYENDLKIEIGRPNKNDDDVDWNLEYAKEIIESKTVFTDQENKTIYEKQNGFLIDITNKLHKELQTRHPHLKEKNLNDVKFKIIGLSDDLPELNQDIIRFKNTCIDWNCQTVETDDIAVLQFPDFDYNPNANPKKWLEIMFSNIPKNEHARVKAGLKAAIVPRLDPRISVIHGLSGVGKSTGLNIMAMALGQYGLILELDQLLGDKFIRARIKGKTLIVLQDMPYDWKDFIQIKNLTGEGYRSERGLYQNLDENFKATHKFWASTNHLAKIPEKEKNPMYNSRLSLVHNIRKESYKTDNELMEKILKEEAADIISWLVNLKDEDCHYEDSLTVRQDWEKLASPEITFIESRYAVEDTNDKIPLKLILKEFKEVYPDQILEIKDLEKALQSLGYPARNLMAWNIIRKKIQQEVIV